MRHPFWPWKDHPQWCLVCGQRRWGWKHWGRRRNTMPGV